MEIAARIRAASRVGIRKYLFLLGRNRQVDFRWFSPSLAYGDVGLALVCGELERYFPGEGWDRCAQDYMTVALASTSQRALGPSLFSGLAGVGFVAESLSRRGTRYRALLGEVDRALALPVRRLSERLSNTYGCRVDEFDLVMGGAGISLYLINRRHVPDAKEMLLQLLTALAKISTAQSFYPSWHTPPKQQMRSICRRFPKGSLNCGLAHGIPGVLSALSIAIIEGIVHKSFLQAIRANAKWIIDNAISDEWGPNWAAALPLERSSRKSIRPCRAAWCYGAPGIARALWLAGRATHDSELSEYAANAWRAFLRRPRSRWGMHSVTFCHGFAGILQIARRFASECPSIVNSEIVQRLSRDIELSCFPKASFGFFDTMPDGSRIERPGVLQGAAGVLLTLLGATSKAESTWDRAFGIS
jgi:hypothetical protein